MPLVIPLVVAGALSGGGSIISGILGSNAAESAASEQEKAQQQVFNTTAQAVQGGQKNVGDTVGIANQILGNASNLFNPYVQQGQSATNSIQNLINGPSSPLSTPFSFNQSDLQNSPGYQFTLAQGQQAIQRAAAAQGGLFSSGTLKSLAGYTTGTAEQYFNDAYNQALGTYSTNTNTALQKINSLQQLANLGYSGTAAQAGLAQGQANNSLQGAEFGSQLGLTGAQIEGGALTAQGNAAAAGTIGSTNAITQGIAGATNAAGSALTMGSLQSLLASLGLGTGSASAPTASTTTPYSTTGTNIQPVTGTQAPNPNNIGGSGLPATAPYNSYNNNSGYLVGPGGVGY
jgi:hypothetical protein